MSWRCSAIVAVGRPPRLALLARDRVPRRGHQVGERLAGAGARLDGQVLAGCDRLLHRLGHRDLPGPLRPADPGDRRGEQVRRAGRLFAAHGRARGAGGCRRRIWGRFWRWGRGARPDVIAAG